MKKLLITATLLTLVATPANAADNVVQTDRGPVQGAATRTYTTYSAVPFAAPPVGTLRWASPQPPAPLVGATKRDNAPLRPDRWRRHAQ